MESVNLGIRKMGKISIFVDFSVFFDLFFIEIDNGRTFYQELMPILPQALVFCF